MLLKKKAEFKLITDEELAALTAQAFPRIWALQRCLQNRALTITDFVDILSPACFWSPWPRLTKLCYQIENLDEMRPMAAISISNSLSKHREY